MSDSLRDRFSGIIGNFLEHYDKALFGLLAPFIAPIFFNEDDSITALILTYSLIPLGVLMRPIGSIFFGWLGDKYGSRTALYYSLLGMGVATTGMGCLPGYQAIGRWSPFFLTIGKILQSFCSAGETTGGAIYVLDNTPPVNRGLVSGYYNVSSIAGILFGSLLVTVLSSCQCIDTCWRYLFLMGGATAFFGFFLRRNAKKTETKNISLSNWFSFLKKHKNALLAIIFASGFSHMTYCLSFTLMNGFVPLITNISKADVMQANTFLLVADMVLLPFFGYLAKRFGQEKVMILGALFCAIGAIPLFSLLEQATLKTVILVRFLIIVTGVAFAAPYYAWALDNVSFQYRYLILSLGSAVGALFLGAPSSTISLWLYKTIQWSAAPGLYLMVGALMATYVVVRSVKKPTAIKLLDR